jgi:hypothetical protein
MKHGGASLSADKIELFACQINALNGLGIG